MKRLLTATTLMTMTLFFCSATLAPAVEPVHMSAKQVKTLATNAQTAQDHRKLAGYFNGEAARLEQDAKNHEELADIFQNHPAVLGSKTIVPVSGSAMHCNNFAKSLREAAKEDRELAAEHELMAQGTGK